MESKKSAYYEQLSEDMKKRYDAKIQKIGKIDPYTIKDKDLSKERVDFPVMSLWDIGNHLIYSISPFTKKMFKAYKSTEAYKFFESGCGLSIGSKKFGDLVIVKGNVKHSQRMNIKSLDAWFLAKLDGEILCGHCTCLAGLSETCSHIAALCFTVQSITNAEKNVSVTELLCKWNVPKFSEVSMSKSKDIKWTSKSVEETTTWSGQTDSAFRSYCDSLSHLSDEVVVTFINELYNDGLDPALRTILYPDEIRRRSNLKDDFFLANMYNDNNKDKSLGALIELGKTMHLEISNADVEEIGRLTLPNLKSKMWLALRRGRITESNLKDCCSTNIQNPSITTINRLINPINFFDHLPSVKYQKKFKKKAIAEYVSQVQEFHENFQYEVSGLIIKDDIPYFASSCDGLVFCECHGRGCIEVKCFKILESEPFDVLMVQPNKMLYKVNEDYFLEKSHDLYYSTQMQIHLSDSSYCDLILWSTIQCLTIRVDPDTEFWEVVKAKAMNFHQQVIIPELLGKYFTERKEENDPKSNEEYQLIGLEIEPVTFEE